MDAPPLSTDKVQLVYKESDAISNCNKSSITGTLVTDNLSRGSQNMQDCGEESSVIISIFLSVTESRYLSLYSVSLRAGRYRV